MRRGVPAATVLLTLGAAVLTGCSGGSSPTGSAQSAGSGAASSSGTSDGPSDNPRASPSPAPGRPATGPTAGRPAGTAPPVPVGRPALFAPGVTARLSAVSVRAVTAELRGEVSGDALTFRLTIRNESRRPVTPDTVVVIATDAGRAPLPVVTAPFTRDLTGSIGPGESRSGTYAFTLSPSVGEPARRPVSVTVTYSAGVRSVRFTGLLS